MTKHVRATFAAAVLALAVPLTITWEGKRNSTYLDIGGVPTACYGQTGAKVRVGSTYSDATCEAWLRAELTETYTGVLACLGAAPGAHARHIAAFVVFAYNIGVSGFCGSASARYARSGDWANACRAIQINDLGKPVWSYVGKRYVQGLANRRTAERALCEGRAPA